MTTLIPAATSVAPTTLDRLPAEQALLRSPADFLVASSDAFEVSEATEISGCPAYL